jgi:hypothetical protein
MNNFFQTDIIEPRNSFSELFRELINEGNNIRIVYSINRNYRGSDVDFENGIFPVVIKSVNGCDSPMTFASKISKISEAPYRRVEEIIMQMTNVEKQLYLIGIIKQVDLLKDNLLYKSVKVVNDENDDNNVTNEIITCYFLNFEWSGETSTNISNIKSELQDATEGFAAAWESCIDVMKSVLLPLIANGHRVEKISINDSYNQGERNKIKTSLSLSEIALLFHLLEERKIIIVEDGEGETLYRNLARIFIPKSNKPGRPTTIRSRYTSPEANAIEYWVHELPKIVDILKDKKNKLSE